MAGVRARVVLFISWLLLASASHADFIGQKGTTLQVNAHVYDSFTVSQTTTFTIYFASDYTAALLVMDASQLSRFTSGQSVSYHEGFDGNYGITSVTLGPGSYVIGARNKSNAANTISYELETWAPEVPDAELYDTYFTEAETLQAGGMLWQPFTVQEGFTYVLEGCNTGLEYYLIPASALNSFRNGGSFTYYPDYSGSGNDTNMPGLFTIDGLPPGDYYLAFRNTGQQSRALVYAMYRYRQDGAGGGGGGSGELELECECGFNISGDSVTLSANRVINGRRDTTGPLKLKLWATTTPYSGGGISGYVVGEYLFSTPLTPNQYYHNINPTVPFKRPPDGMYYLTLALSETVGGVDYIEDHITFDDRYTFGNPGTGGGGLQPHELQGISHGLPPTGSSARFRIGLSLDGSTYVDQIRRGQTAQVLGTIIPEPQHIGRKADIFVVDRYNWDRFMMQNESGSFVDWNTLVSDLVPFRRNVTLTANTPITMYWGSFALSGDHRFFLGYKVAGEPLRYIPTGLRFDVLP